MRYLKLIFCMLICTFTFLPLTTFAESIINNNGIEISEEDYENFLLVHSHEYIMTMNEDQYEKLLSLDYSNIQKVTKYVATTYNPSLNLVTETEITQAEYENFVPMGFASGIGGNQINVNNGYAYTETNAKILSLALAGGSVYNYLTLTATWKYIPVTRSYDVIGFRFDGFSVRNGSQHGEQVYLLGGNYNVINYSWNGTNINNLSNGFGISMNIVDSNITALQLEVECDIEQTASFSQLFGSYQHAISSLTLADSQNYVLNGGGLGDVFSHPYNIRQKYDGMSGLSLTYN